MNIETVKHSGYGYLVNGTISVPKSDGNKDYQAVLSWIDNGGVVGAELTSEQQFQKAVEEKEQQIESDYIEAEKVPVVFLQETYFGGHESASSIDGYVRLTRLAGLDVFKIWDVNGDEHIHTGATVDALLLEIGVPSSRNKFEKKDRKIALSKATTIAEVNAV